ncbi:TIGR03985 family CRISPR-associated protein [Lyngbya confervoides]|uniref:TIGR03985 family CRISPR-associated protein n=1 Tax=Lyngbya confervoides BDU141951 TaxID=1574623 RepID=A0ABD4T5E5_9CYAN|nr:TIGR03985 family CRISPR-associated protein [Lyngbya confervoides]MCM1983749.1 TIGR03985 family CRISPR-associated protein [Lyngbya confervoides BDU141951]
MTIPAPHIDILEQLSSQGSIASLNALKKTLRVWLILASIEDNPLALPIPFTYTQWHSAAIADQGMLNGELQDVYESSLADYLTRVGEVDLENWIQDYCDRYNCTPEFIEQRLRKQKPFLLRTQIPENQKRSLEYDFLQLKALGYLEELDANGQSVQNSQQGKQARYYRRSPKPLTRSKAIQSFTALKSHVLNGRYKHVDLRELLVIFEQPIQQQQRFFLDLDNVVAIEAGQKVSAIAQFLKHQVWQQNPIPPIQFTYNSRSRPGNRQMITFPLCLYYYQRAPYLMAYGQSPQPHLPEITWYNFRTEQISSPRVLSWATPDTLPPSLYQQYQQDALPTPDQIINALESAWGFEIGSPKQPVLLRFQRAFHDQYIHRSNRHETFKPLKTWQAQQQYLQTLDLTEPERQNLLGYLQRHPQDAYYKAIVRDNDNGLVMRLRAWGPNVEVLYPFHLRDRMARDIQQTYALYQAES